MLRCRASRKPRIPSSYPVARRRSPTKFGCSAPTPIKATCLRLQQPGKSASSSQRISKARPLKDQKAILAEVPVKVPPAINTDYPTTLPLATVPPHLLLKLPTLPEELEYRFLGRHLILRDIKANLIVDFIPDVVPEGPAASAGRDAHP